MEKMLFCLVNFAVGLFLGYFIVVGNIKPVEPVIAIPDAPITLDHLEKQCELTFWTQEGQQTHVPVKMPADDIVYQIKGSDAVPNGLYPSYYKIEGLSLNGKPVYAITGFIPERLMAKLIGTE